ELEARRDDDHGGLGREPAVATRVKQVRVLGLAADGKTARRDAARQVAHVPAARDQCIRARREFLKETPVAWVADGRRNAELPAPGIGQRDASIEAADEVCVD